MTKSPPGKDNAEEVNKVRGEVKDKTETIEGHSEVNGVEGCDEVKAEEEVDDDGTQGCDENRTETKTETKSGQDSVKDVPQERVMEMEVQGKGEAEVRQEHDQINESETVQISSITGGLFQGNEWSGYDVPQVEIHKTIKLEPLQDINEAVVLLTEGTGEVAMNQEHSDGERLDYTKDSTEIKGESTRDKNEVADDLEDLNTEPVREVNPFHFNPTLLNGQASESEQEDFQENERMHMIDPKDTYSDEGLPSNEEYDADDYMYRRKITLGDLDIDMSQLEYRDDGPETRKEETDSKDEAKMALWDMEHSETTNNDSILNETDKDVKQGEKDEAERHSENHPEQHTGDDIGQGQENQNMGDQGNGASIPSGQTSQSQSHNEDTADMIQEPGNKETSKATVDTRQKSNTADETRKPDNEKDSDNSISIIPEMTESTSSPPTTINATKSKFEDARTSGRSDKDDEELTTTTTKTETRGNPEDASNGNTNDWEEKEPTTPTSATSKSEDEAESDEGPNDLDSDNLLGLNRELLKRLLPHMSPALLPIALRPPNSPDKTRDNAKSSTETNTHKSAMNSLNVIKESSEAEESDEELPMRPPSSHALLRRNSFHHFPAPPPESNSKKAETVRALLQAVEEEELEKISKRLAEKADLVRQHLGHVENRLFDMFGDKDKRTININKFLMGLTATGMRPTDPRLKQTRDNIKKLQDSLGTEFVTLEVDYDTFMSMISENLEVVVRAFSASFVIPDFQGFCKQIEEIYNICYANHSGRPAQYIPQLARFNSKSWGVSLCTVDGQRFSLGDVDVPYTIQSCSKPLTYAIALALNGTEYIHKYVGMEPSGRYFNELVLDYNNKPHNPMINSGAIMTAAIIKPELSAADRFDYMFKVYKRLAGDEYLGFNNSVFLSEKECADRNFALAYFMRENKCFPKNHKLHESLDFYFQLCSMEITAESGAVMAATLANGGLNPLTGDPVLTVDAVRNTLTLMHSCGMYNYSGQFAFQVGLPAKSGVSGCVLLVVPNTMGICLWSPPLDSNGNSCRGVQFCMEMVSRFNFHNFDNLRGYTKLKQDPRMAKTESKAQILFDLLFSAAAGDISALRRHSLAGTDMQAKDYDGRTALHVATSEGHHEAVDFLLNRCNVHPLPKDRWDRTPLDDAESFDHPKCSKLLTDCCKKKGIELPISYKDYLAINNKPNGTNGALVAAKSS